MNEVIICFLQHKKQKKSVTEEKSSESVSALIIAWTFKFKLLTIKKDFY